MTPLKGQLELEADGARTTSGVLVLIWQRLLAVTASSATTTTPASQSNDH